MKIKSRQNIIRLECLYAKKWDEIWVNKNHPARKKLEKLLIEGIRRMRIDYGHFWKEEKQLCLKL